MVTVLVCALGRNVEPIQRTLLARRDVEREFATSLDEAMEAARIRRPRLVLVDRDLPDAEGLVTRLRALEGTRHASIVVVASRGAVPERFVEAGANAVLRLPAGPDWDEKLGRLLAVPARREARLPLEIALHDAGASTRGTIHNLSRMGMLVESPAELRVGEQLAFSFDLGTGPAICGRGRVVRAAGPQAWGIEFLDLEGLGGARVASFVSARWFEGKA